MIKEQLQDKCRGSLIKEQSGMPLVIPRMPRGH